MSSSKVWQQISRLLPGQDVLGNVSPDVVYFNPREYIFSDYQIMFGCSQDLTLSLGVSHGSKSQLLEVSQHKG